MAVCQLQEQRGADNLECTDPNSFKRWIYVASAVLALYLNAFVGVVHAFLKFPALKEMAPTQSEPPFLVAQFVLLATCIALGVGAVLAFRPLSRG